MLLNEAEYIFCFSDLSIIKSVCSSNYYKYYTKFDFLYLINVIILQFLTITSFHAEIGLDDEPAGHAPGAESRQQR